MLKIISIIAGGFFTTASMGQTNNASSQTRAWGASTNDVQISASITNNLLSSGSTAYFSIAIKNGTTNTINIPPNQSTDGGPYVTGELVNALGKRFSIRPKPPQFISRVAGPISIAPGVTANWEIGLRVMASEGGGAFGDIAPGDYKFRATARFSRKVEEHSDAWSNVLNLQIK